MFAAVSRIHKMVAAFSSRRRAWRNCMKASDMSLFSARTRHARRAVYTMSENTVLPAGEGELGPRALVTDASWSAIRFREGNSMCSTSVPKTVIDATSPLSSFNAHRISPRSRTQSTGRSCLDPKDRTRSKTPSTTSCSSSKSRLISTNVLIRLTRSVNSLKFRKMRLICSDKLRDLSSGHISR